MRVGLVSLGCPKNLVDSEVMLGALAQAGHTIVSDPEEADAIIVNTCSFIQEARAEARKTLREMASFKRRNCKFLIMAGCLTRHGADDLRREFPGVDAFVGLGEFPAIADTLALLHDGGVRPVRVGERQYLYDSRAPRILATPPWRAYVKIAEGCSHRCSFCAIPAIRGRMQSRPIGDILDEVRGLAERGVKEISIVAQDTTAYGRDIYGRPAIAELVGTLAREGDVEWVRLLYCFPRKEVEEVAAVMAVEPSVCNYLDLPFQHASGRLLRMMRRPGDADAYLRMLERLRRQVPGLAVRTTLLVGFPGETDDDFETLLRFVKEARFDRLGVFTYSREQGTPAAEMDGAVPAKVARERRKQIMLLQKRISREINQALIGRKMAVLVEGRSSGRWTARSYRDAPEIDGLVYVRGKRLNVGEFAEVQVAGASDYDLEAVA